MLRNNYKKILLLLGLLIALPVFGAVKDIKVKKTQEIPLTTASSGFVENEVVDISLLLSDEDLVRVKDAFALTVGEKAVLEKILTNEAILDTDIPTFLAVYNKMQLQSSFSVDEWKYMAGMKGEGVAGDRVKYLSKKKLKEI